MLIVHGVNDEVISVKHSRQLHAIRVKEKLETILKTPIRMTHNTWEWEDDLKRPILQFFQKYQIVVHIKNLTDCIKLPHILKQSPFEYNSLHINNNIVGNISNNM